MKPIVYMIKNENASGKQYHIHSLQRVLVKNNCVKFHPNRYTGYKDITFRSCRFLGKELCGMHFFC